MQHARVVIHLPDSGIGEEAGERDYGHVLVARVRPGPGRL